MAPNLPQGTKRRRTAAGAFVCQEAWQVPSRLLRAYIVEKGNPLLTVVK